MARRIEVPDGWKISLLDSVTKRGSGHTPDKEHPEYWNGGIKWVSLADSHRLDAGTISETDKEISELGIAKSSAVVHPSGTVILSRDAGVGKSAVLDGDMAVSQHFIAWRCSPSLGLQNWFLYSWLQFNKREFERQAVGSTIKTIGLPYFKRLQICYPPYREQSAIVDIIRTWDRAIERVEALIANAHAQKKALMQQLLPQGTTPPKKRLPGFSGQWLETSLADLLSVKRAKGKIVPTNQDGDGVPYIGSTSFLGQFSNYTTSQGALHCVKTDILVLWDGEYAGKVATGLTGAVSSTVGRYRLAKPKADPVFVVTLMEKASERIRSIREGSGIPHMPGDFEHWFKFAMPPLDEQQAIAEVFRANLVATDALQAQLTALRQEKAALMQQLLIGKRRVKLPESEAA